MKKSLPNKNILDKIKQFIFSDWGVIIFLLSLTGFLNLWRLAEIPAALNNDMAITAAEGKWIANHVKGIDFTLKGIPYIYPAFPRHLFVGSLSVQVFLHALVFLIFPIHQLTIHGLTAFTGTIEVIPFYFMVKALFNRKMAFWGSFFYFTSPWHLAFARSGGVYYFVLSITLITILWLLAFILQNMSSLRKQGSRTKSWIPYNPFGIYGMTKENRGMTIWRNLFIYLAIGLLFGFQLANGYPLFIITPVLIFLILIWNRWRHLPYIFLIGLGAGIFFIGWSHFLVRLVDFSFFQLFRNDTDSVWIIYRLIKGHFFIERFGQQADLSSSIKEAWERLFQWMFVASDRSLDLAIWRIRGYPLLQWPFSVLMSFGLVASVIFSFFRKSLGDRVILLWFLLTIILFGIKVVPSERYLWIGLPAMAMLAARGWDLILEKTKTIKKLRMVSYTITATAAIVYLFFFSWKPYFVTYAAQDGNEPTTYANQQIANFFNENYPNQDDIFIIATSRFSTLPFLTEFRYNLAGWRDQSSVVDWPALEEVLKDNDVTDYIYTYDLAKVDPHDFFKALQKSYHNNRFAFLFNMRSDLYLYDPTSFMIGQDIYKEFKKLFPDIKPALEIPTSLGEPGISVYIIEDEDFNNPSDLQ